MREFGRSGVDISSTFFHYVHIIASMPIHWMEKQLPRNRLGTSEKHDSKELRRTEIRPKHRVALHVCEVFFGKQLNVCARVCVFVFGCETHISSARHMHTHTHITGHVPIRPFVWILFFAIKRADYAKLQIAKDY